MALFHFQDEKRSHRRRYRKIQKVPRHNVQAGAERLGHAASHLGRSIFLFCDTRGEYSEVSVTATFWEHALKLDSRFQDTVNAKYFSVPDCLWLLATFTLRAYVAASRSSRAARLPLLAAAPLDDGYCLIVGVPTVAETAPRR